MGWDGRVKWVKYGKMEELVKLKMLLVHKLIGWFN